MLPYFQTEDPAISKLQTTWGSQLNPVLKNQLLNGLLISNLALTTGVNTISHRLSRKQQGWIVTDTDGTATVYRSAPFNTLTLELTASAPITISIWCF